MLAVLAVAPKVAVLTSPLVLQSDAVFEMTLRDLVLHFVTNWIIWSGVAGLFVLLWRKAKPFALCLLLLALAGVFYLAAREIETGGGTAPVYVAPTVPYYMATDPCEGTQAYLDATAALLSRMQTNSDILLADPGRWHDDYRALYNEWSSIIRPPFAFISYHGAVASALDEFSFALDSAAVGDYEGADTYFDRANDGWQEADVRFAEARAACPQ
jgi:hypothetical protein